MPKGKEPSDAARLLERLEKLTLPAIVEMSEGFSIDLMGGSSPTYVSLRVPAKAVEAAVWFGLPKPLRNDYAKVDEWKEDRRGWVAEVQSRQRDILGEVKVVLDKLEAKYHHDDPGCLYVYPHQNLHLIHAACLPPSAASTLDKLHRLIR